LEQMEPDAGVPAPGSATDESAPATPAVSGPVRVGDQVVLDAGTAAAEVLEIDGDQAVISFDSMRLRASVDRLRKVGGRRRQEVRLGSIQQSGLPALGARTRIDLRGRRVDEAIVEVAKFIDEGLMSIGAELEIMHSYGTGAVLQVCQS